MSPQRVKKAERVDVLWDGVTWSGALSEGDGPSRLAIRTPRSLIVGLVLEVGDRRLKVTALEPSLTAGFRLAIVEDA